MEGCMMKNELIIEWRQLSKKAKEDLYSARRDWLLRKLAQFDYDQVRLSKAMKLAEPHNYIRRMVKKHRITLPQNAKNE